MVRWSEDEVMGVRAVDLAALFGAGVAVGAMLVGFLMRLAG